MCIVTIGFGIIFFDTISYQFYIIHGSYYVHWRKEDERRRMRAGVQRDIERQERKKKEKLSQQQPKTEP